jgi:hypothetical protein
LQSLALMLGRLKLRALLVAVCSSKTLAIRKGHIDTALEIY